MASTQKGTVGALRGIPAGTTLTVKSLNGVAISTDNQWAVISSYEYTNEAKSDEIPGNDSGPMQIAGWDYRRKLRVEAMAAVAGAGGKQNALDAFVQLPSFLDTVDIASTGDTQIAGSEADNTAWHVQSATKRGIRDGYAVATFELFSTDADLEFITS